MHEMHNHGPSISSSSHPAHRRRDRAPHLANIQSMLTTGSRPQIVTASLLQANSELFINRSDMSNIRERDRQAYLQGRSPIQALLTELDESIDWISSIETGPDGRLKSLFFAHSSQVELI
jgi:hypothetical protein